MPAGHLWKGTPIKLETEFVLTHKLKPSLEAIGASLDDVVKAQVYLRDEEDVPAFNEVWLRHFPRPPATTVIPTAKPGFIVSEGRIEINTIALRPGSGVRRLDLSGPGLFGGWSSGVLAADLLFLSGMIAADTGGMVPGTGMDAGAPFASVPIKEEVRVIAARAQALCRQAGADLRHLTRLQLYLTDLADLPASLEAWSAALAGAPLPISAIEVDWLPVPGASIMADLCIYAGGR